MARSIVILSFILSSNFLNTFAISPLHLRRIREIYLTSDSATTYRLPNNTKPEAYNLFISTNIADAIFDYYGVVKINITILEESNEVTLHQLDLNINSVNLTSKQNEEITIQSPRYDRLKDFVIFKTINHTFTPGEKVFLEIKYKGKHRGDSYGFYRSYYDDYSSEIADNNINSSKKSFTKKWLATTHFEPTSARRAFPCYDEPALKATFDIQIAHSFKYTAISNMPQIERKISKSQAFTRFQRTPLMSTYLVAFIVSDFDYKEKISVNGFRHRIYAQPDKIDRVQFALDKSDKILTALSNYLEVNYTLPKSDQAAIPDFPELAGAMENWGIITYDSEYLFDRGNENIVTIVTFISHEFSHSWFGNLVTPKSWSYLWLSEGLATLFEYIGTDLVQPDWKIFSRFLIGKLHSALQFDATNLSRPLTYYAESPSDINNLFDVFAFDKASSVLRMFMHAFTENSFRKGLKYYLTENAYKAVTDMDLFESLDRAVKEDGTLDKEMNVMDIFSSWSDQRGYPLLIVTRNYTDNTIHITQERYFLEQQHFEVNLTSWWIPYNFYTANNIAMDDTKPDGWLAKGTKSMIIKPTKQKNWTSNDWVLFNKQQTGFYRVLYDERNYQLILDYLKSGNANKIHTDSKVQLSDDICEFSHGHRLPRNFCGDFEYYLWENN